MSLTISSLIVALLGFLMNTLGIEVSQGELDNFIVLAMQLGGILAAWYGRWRVSEAPVSIFGVRQ
jgi:uncharacterized membrane protein YfcA